MNSDVVVTPYGQLPARYKSAKLAEVCVQDGGVQTGPFGSQLHQRDYVSSGTPIITVEHLGDNRIIHRDIPKVSAEDQERLSRYSLRRGDIVFSRVGSVDIRALVRKEEEGWLFSGRCLRVRPKPEAVDSAYLSWFFGLPTFRQYVRNIAFGATMPSLNTRLLSELPIYFPPLSEQRAIAAILGALDDKIELNRRMNETLEAMSQALFKSWFVEFDPFRDQDMQESPLGLIPKGWQCSTVAEAVDINPSRRLERGADAVYVDMSALPTASARVLETTRRPFSGSGSRFANGDVLLARITPCLENGKTALVDFLKDRGVGWGSTEFIVLGPKPPLGMAFNYCLARYPDFRAHAIQAMTGTSGRQRVDPGCFDHYWLAVPPAPVAQQFQEKVSPWFQKMKANDDESRALAAIRDALLPRLLSGEIRVKDAERFLEGVA